ncbi:MAG: DUF4976 domain-containing protein, partial [Verrucomicrobiota bacterium]|nr:DUF4976 domain-containing protein [Verrucomicrobiota bacterium]
QTARTDRWKYIHYPDLKEMDELYDLKNDPFEMKNLIQETTAQTSLQEMKAELKKLLEETK